MATFISDNQKFHIFSKSPVRANMELFQATNKSGHTVISDEVRTDDIPWFINVPDVNNPPSYVKDPRKNDIIFQGKFNSLSTAAVCKKWDGEKWVDGPNLKDDPILKNKNDDDVIQVHFENDIEYVSDTNNAGTTSDKQAAFVLKANGEMLTHFVSPTDKIYNGIPSNGYGLYLFLDSQLQSETDSNDSGYIANSYAGIIQFNKARSEAASKFKVITFEYIGGYLSKSLDKLEDDLKDYIDEEIKEHNEEFIAHKINQNSEKHLSQSEVDSLTALTSADKISGIETATQYDYQAETDLDKALSSQISTPNASDETYKNVTVTLHLRDKVLQQSTMPVTSKAIYNHVHKQSVNIEKASDNVTVEEVTTKENERRKYTIAVDGYTTSETDNIVDDIHEKIQATADDINKNVVEHTSNNGIHITDAERVSWNNNEVVLQKHLNDQNSHVSEADRILWDKGGNTNITGDNFIISEKTDANWSLTLDKSLFENKVEALPSVYTGNNEAYINCYGFEYTSPSENIIFDKIEIKFAKDLDTLTKLTIGGAPEISAGEVENNICKITVAKVKTPTDAEIEIATSDYNTNISNEVDLSQFKFSKNIILEKGWNYRFYFYDKNDNLFAAPVIVNTLPIGDSLLPRNSVANRWLSERYDYWGAYNFKHNGLGIVANGLAVKLINVVQEHINDSIIHVTSADKEKWNKILNTTTISTDLISPSDVNEYIEWEKKLGDEIPTSFCVADALMNHSIDRITHTDGIKYAIHVGPEERIKWDNKLDAHSANTLINEALNDYSIIKSIKSCEPTGTFGSKPSCINIHGSLLPNTRIQYITSPTPLVSTARYLRIKIVNAEGTKPYPIFTSAEAGTSTWKFENLPVPSESTYWKLYLVSSPDEDDNVVNSYIYFNANIPFSNDAAYINAGFGGSKKDSEINTNVVDESGIEPALPELIFITYPIINCDGHTTIEKIDGEDCLSLKINTASTLNEVDDEKIALVGPVRNATENLLSQLTDHTANGKIHFTKKTSENLQDQKNDTSNTGNIDLVRPIALARGFVWKSKDYTDLTSISFKVTNDFDTKWVYNPLNLTSSFLPYTGLTFSIHITDETTGELLASQTKTIPANNPYPWDSPYDPNIYYDQELLFSFNTPIKCIKNRNYIITFHSSEDSKPDIILPLIISLNSNKSVDEYIINKFIIDENLSIHTQENPVNDILVNTTPGTTLLAGGDIFINGINVTLNGEYYYNPEIEKIKKAIDDIWVYLKSMTNYILQK